MKKVHILSFSLMALFSYVSIYLLNLYSFLSENSPLDPTTSNVRDIYTIIPEHLHGLWKFYDKLGSHFSLLVMLSILMTVITFIFFFLTYDPEKTRFIRTSVEMVSVIFVVALYLISMGFQGLRTFVTDNQNLLFTAQFTTLLLGVVLYAKHILAKIRLGIFRQSSLLGLLGKPAKAVPKSDDVKDLKDSLGIDGLNAPWIHPIRF